VGQTVFAHLITARRTVALGALVLALGVVACGDDESSGGGGGGGGGGSKEAKLAFVYPTTTTNFAQEMALGAKAAADATPGVKLTESAPAEVNRPKQVQLFQAAARSSKDGVAMMTLTPDLFIRPLQQAGDQNVPLVAVDVPPPKGTEEDVKLLIGNSNEEIGQDLAKALLPKIPADAKGEIMMGTDTPGLPVLEQRNKGFQDVMKKERPGVKSSSSTPSRARRTTSTPGAPRSRRTPTRSPTSARAARPPSASPASRSATRARSSWSAPATSTRSRWRASATAT
jgi:ABC-type sugar transport system substrate-binding protein